MQKAIGGDDMRPAHAADGAKLLVHAVKVIHTKPLGTDSALGVIVV